MDRKSKRGRNYQQRCVLAVPLEGDSDWSAAARALDHILKSSRLCYSSTLSCRKANGGEVMRET